MQEIESQNYAQDGYLNIHNEQTNFINSVSENKSQSTDIHLNTTSTTSNNNKSNGANGYMTKFLRKQKGSTNTGGNVKMPMAPIDNSKDNKENISNNVPVYENFSNKNEKVISVSSANSNNKNTTYGGVNNSYNITDGTTCSNLGNISNTATPNPKSKVNVSIQGTSNAAGKIPSPNIVRNTVKEISKDKEYPSVNFNNRSVFQRLKDKAHEDVFHSKPR